jgi:type II secretory pathway pseudopilin PulG
MERYVHAEGVRLRIDAKVVAIALLIVAAVTASATFVAFGQSRRATALEAELAATEAQRAKVANHLKAAMTELHWLKAASQAEPDAPDAIADAPDTTDEATPASAEREDSTTLKKFAFVNKAYTQGSTVWLALDYASFVTDPDSIKAATKKTGDEYPPPNDYYIYNPSAKLREFRMADDAAIKIMLYGPEDTETLSPEEFVIAFADNTDQVADAGYWVTIEDGRVTRLVEQWTP